MGNKAPHRASTTDWITALEGNSRNPYSRLRPTVVRHCSRTERRLETMTGRSELDLLEEASESDWVMRKPSRKNQFGFIARLPSQCKKAGILLPAFFLIPCATDLPVVGDQLSFVN